MYVRSSSVAQLYDKYSLDSLEIAMGDEDRMHEDIADMMYGFGDSEW